MGRAASVVVAVVGAGIGALAWWTPDVHQASDRLGSLVRAAAGPSDAAVPPPAVVAAPVSVRAPVRAFSPREPLIAEKVASDLGGPATPPIIIAQATVAPTADAGSKRPLAYTTAKPSDGEARRELVRSIHRELHRVGCFDGDLDSAWSSKSRQGMKAFTDRINASLPVEEPDYILLTLLQGHKDKACGKGCPAGQVPAQEGRCQPRAVVAQSDRQTQKRPLRRTDGAESAQVASTRQAAPVAPLPGRMAVGAPSTTSAADERKEADAASEALRRQQVLIEQRKARLEAERQAQARAAEEARAKAQAEREERRRRVAAIEQAEAERHRVAAERARQTEVERQARLEADRQAQVKLAEEARVKAQADREERRRRVAAIEQAEAEQRAIRDAERQARREAERQRVEQARLEAERVRAEKIEAERIARAKREEERRVRIAAAEAARRLEADKAAEARQGAAASARPAETASIQTGAQAPGARSEAPAAAPVASPPAAVVLAAPSVAPAGVVPVQPQPADAAKGSEVKSAANAKPSDEAAGQTKPPVAPKRKSQPSRNHADRAPPMRFVQRFVPPPPYYVGRTSAPSRAVFYARDRVAPSFRSTIFTGLSRSAP